MNLKLLMASAIGVMLLSGCSAKVGQDFIKPNDNSLVLGQTTYSQIVHQIGKPYKESIKTINDCQIEEASYMYVNTSGDGIEYRTVPGRFLTLSFADKKLVGKIYISSFKIDSSDFDNTKVNAIKKGETTYDQVISILGNPTGMQIAPLVTAPSVKGISYVFVMTKTKMIGNGTETMSKSVNIEFDDKNVVSKINASSN